VPFLGYLQDLLFLSATIARTTAPLVASSTQIVIKDPIPMETASNRTYTPQITSSSQPKKPATTDIELKHFIKQPVIYSSKR
jgi:hypothetical protein